MLTSIRKIIFTFALLTATFIAFSQAVVTIDQQKDACNGLANGSVRLTVTSGVGPFSYFLFGLSNGSGPFFGSLTLGVPFTVTNLPADNYILSIPDGDGANPNFSTFIAINNVATPLGVTVSPGFPVNNTDCAFPNGQISITPTGGTGSYSFDWDGPGAYNSTLEDIAGLAGGTYQVTVFDNGTNCSVSLGSIVVTDPSPAVQTVSTPSPQIICTGTNASISLANTEGAIVTYEVLINGTPSGITTTGVNGPITLNVPFTSISDGDILTVRAINGVCTPVNMTGAVTLSIVPLPVPALGGSASVCAGTTGVVYTTDPGQTNYLWTVSAGGTITAGGGTTDNTVTVTWNTAGPQTVSVNYTNSNGCTGATPTVLNVTVNPLPVPTLSGSLAVCVGTTGVVYTTEAGQTNYIWNVSAGGTITSGGTATSNTVTVTWGTAGPQTVSVNYNDANGCTAAAATVANVTVSPLPVPTITGSTTVCAGSTGNVYSTEVGKTGYTWVVSAGGTITAGGTVTDNTVTVTWNTAAPQTVSVSYTDPSGCPAAVPTVSNITVNPQPTPALSGSTVVCANTTGVVYTTDAGQANYVWTVSAGGTITAGGGAGNNTVTVTWNTAGPQTVTVNYDNAFGCAAATPTTLNVTVNPLPVPTLTGSITACVGTTGVVYTTDAGQSNYVWTVSAGGTITSGGTSTSNTATISWNASGAQNVTVSYTDANGCLPATPTLLNVTVSPLPVPSLTGPTPVCAGSTLNVYSTDAGQSNYVWTVSAGGTITAGGTATDNTVTVTWNTAGAGTVQVNYTSVSGCTAVTPTNLNVTVNPLPIPTLSGSTSSCVGATGVVYTTDAGQANYTWAVSAGGTITSGGSATDNTVTVTWTIAGPQTVSVNYTNASGCTAATPTVSNVTVNPLPVPTLTGSTTVCAGATGVVYTTDAGQSNYVWVVSGGTITAGGTATSNTVTVTWGTAGAHSVSVIYTGSTGCNPVAPTVVPVTVNPVPTPALAGTTSLCVGTTGVVYTTDAGQSNYVWTVSSGGTITAGGTATDNTVTVSWLTAGAQTVTVNYTNASGCAAPTATSLGVTVNALPVPTLTGSTSVCVGATGVVYSTNAGQSNYVWTVSGGGAITAGGTATDNTVTITWGTAGPQTVSVNYTDINGCSAGLPTQSNVTVNPLPTPSLSGSTSVCAGSIGNVYTTDAGQSNYIWTVSGGGTITAGGTATDNTVTVTWTSAGPQTVSVNYTSTLGCAAAAATVSNVTVNSTPTPSLSGTALLCVGTTGVVYTTDAGQSNYVWTVSGGTITSGGTATDNTVTVTWGTAGAQSVAINYTNASGCAASTPTTLPVVVNPLPVPALGGSTNVCLGTTGVVYTTDPGQSNYVWTVSAGGTITAGGTATDNTVTITWGTAGAQTVSVSYTNTNGCIAATPTVLNVTVNNTITPALAGSNAVCVGTTGVVYTTDPGQSNYAWAVSAGGTITSGGTATDNTVTITWGTAGAQSVTVSYTDINGCPVPTPTVLNVAVGTVPTPSLVGSITSCVGTTNVVYSTDLGQSNYVWTVSAGGTITAGGTATDNTVTVTWTTAGAQAVSVNYSSSGCTAPAPTSLAVTVNALPVPTLSGLAAVCAGTTGVVYTTEAGQSNYAWTVSGGGTITAGGTATDNTVTVTWGTAGPQSVSVNYQDVNGCSAAAATSQAVTVNTLPVPTITGSNSLCEGSTGNVYTTESGQSNYTWGVTGGTITAGGTTTDNTITITWGAAGTGSVSVNYTDAAGCSASTPTTSNVTINGAPVPTLTGNTSVCAGSTGNVYTTEVGQSNYVWTVSAGGTITAGGTATDNTVTVTWATAGANTVSVNYTASGCTAAIPTSVAVTVNALPTATLSGTNSICIGSSSTLTFTLTGTGPWDVVYTDGTTNFPVNFATSPGTVSVTPFIATTYSLVSVTNVQCGAGTTSGTATITVNPIPGDQVTFGNETWIGYVYTDAASPAPPVSNINFAAAKYRGFVNETDMAGLGVSTYNTATDEFDLNLTNAFPLSGPNVCGSFLDDFSVRYKMQKNFAAGVYTFTVGSDDGVRFLVDGVNIIPAAAFTTHAYQTFTATVCMTAGVHDLQIEYFERGGFSRLSFDYDTAPTPTVTSPVAVCVGSATAPTLTASSTDASVTTFNWYSDAGLTNLVGTGASFTPTVGTGTGELDLSAVGSTSYFVTSVYTGCESGSSTIVVNVVNGATFSVTNSSVCESGGIVDLLSFTSGETPAGGTFVFTGHPAIAGTNFDPAGLAGSSVPITVDYSVGSCTAPTVVLTLTITNTSVTTVPATPVPICESSGAIDLNTLVSAVPAGGDFVFTAAAGITGDSFDPATLSGIQTITVDYTIGGGCAAATQTFDIDVLTNATLTTSNTTVCPNDADVDLTTLITTATPAGGTFTFSGSSVTGNFFDPSAHAGSTVTINVLYDAGGCTPVAGTIQVTVRSAGDPLCNVVTGNCATVVITPVPTPATCTNSDGSITFNINPFTPAINNTGVIIDIQGISSTNLTISRTQFNDPVFTALPMGVYDYTITYGDLSCIKTGQVTIDQSGTVGTPVASSIVQPICAGSATGAVTIDVPGETGNVLEWSYDGGITDPFKPFTAGSQITGIPAGPAPTFERVISVRRNSSDPCNASVRIVIQDANAPITATFETADATCSASDGRIFNIVPSGGTGAPYEYSLNGGTTYQSDNFFDNVPGGTYALRVKDAIGCEQDITVVVTSPGSVNSIVSGTDADCSNNGNSGSVSVTITDVGTFQVALSTDQFNEPTDAEYQNYTGPTTFFDLSANRYYVYMRSTGSLCPDRKEVVINGAYSITFEPVPICSTNQFSVSLTNISGDAAVPFTITVFVKSTNTKVVDQEPFILDASGNFLMSFNDPRFSFLQNPGAYEIVLEQSMVNAPFCVIQSEKVNLLIPDPITAQVNTESIKASFRDESSGQFEIINIQGGSLIYTARIELVQPLGNDQSYEEIVDPVGSNPDGDFEVLFDKIPAGVYEVTIEDSYGCSLVPPIDVTVPLDTRVIPPNIFTPNNDGFNDTFYIRNLPNVGNHELIITDRWGKQVYKTSKYNSDNFWDGEGVSDGVYFYKLQVDGGGDYNGWVEILRGTKP